MKLYEVVVDVPSKEQDWCLYDNKEVWVNTPTTTAILTARDLEHLKDKITKHYGDAHILRIKEIS